MNATEVRVVLPGPLRTLARLDRETLVAVTGRISQRTVIDALENEYPALRGTIRDATTGRRRPFIRLFACGQDLSHDEPDGELPAAVIEGTEPLLIVGAMAGG
ncbi:MAG TPA: MoaD/ThiS family protein [Acidothermaceae bacterium]|jgi:molybdopterin converting factor small subunit